MKLFKSKEAFKSKIPSEFRFLTLDSMTDKTMKEIQDMFPEITTPKYIDTELEKGHISEDKAIELKKRFLLNSLNRIIEKEKEDFFKNNDKKITSSNRKRILVSVYESECSGIITHEETDFLIDALKR